MAEREPGTPHVDVAGYLLGTLPPGERAAFRAHLAECPRCAHELEELRRMPALLRHADAPVDPPGDLEGRVFAALAAEPPRSARPAPPRVLPARPRRAAWRWIATTAAAAAVLVVAIGIAQLTGLGRPGGGGSPPVATQTVQLVAADGSSAAGTARIQRTGSGRAIQLTVTNLAPPPAGHYYVCWLVAEGDTLGHQDRVSVGSFTVTGSGPVTVRWETAADPARYPHLGVTLEPDDGNPLRRGPKVLSAA